MAEIEIRGRKSRSREEAAAELADKTWEGTKELVLAVAEESRYVHGWRPLRATLTMALRDLKSPAGGVVLTGEQFAAWESEAKALCKVRGDGLLRDRIGLTLATMRTIRKEGAGKALALACAHYSLGLPMPIPAEDPRAFDEWFRPRFSAADRVAEWLDLNPQWLSARLAGFRVKDDQRLERLPPAWLIRALDWLFTIGPVCPYGAKTFVPYWPGQDLEEGY